MSDLSAEVARAVESACIEVDLSPRWAEDITPGLVERLLPLLTARSADMKAQRDAASMRSGEWARRNWNASAGMKARIKALAEEFAATGSRTPLGQGTEVDVAWCEAARRLRALLDAAPAGGAEAVETGWECGPHTNAWGGHDARCRRVSDAPSEAPHD